MEKLRRFLSHQVLWPKPEIILQNKITTFCWLNTNMLYEGFFYPHLFEKSAGIQHSLLKRCG